MELRISGKLTSASRSSLAGFAVEASYESHPMVAPSLALTSMPTTTDRVAERLPGSASPMMFRVSTLSDDAGNFALVLPDSQKIATGNLKLTVSRPEGRIIRKMDITRAE